MSEKTRLLLVDDDDHVRSALGRFLVKLGYDVTQADSGLAAIQKLDSSPSFAAMVSDIRMPGMSGLELLPKAIAHDPDMAIIMLTAVGDPGSAIQCLRLGATDYLIKPVEVEELEHALKYALRKRELEIDRRALEQWLAQQVAEKTQELEEQALRVELMALSILTALVDSFEPRTNGRNHSLRVANLCAHVASQAGLSPEETETVRMAARLHDLGRVSSLKGDSAEPPPVVAARLLEPLAHHAAMTQIVRRQLDRWDTAGDAIPIGARILAAVNLLDETDLDSVRNEAGKSLDPAVVEALERVVAGRG